MFYKARSGGTVAEKKTHTTVRISFFSTRTFSCFIDRTHYAVYVYFFFFLLNFKTPPYILYPSVVSFVIDIVFFFFSFFFQTEFFSSSLRAWVCQNSTGRDRKPSSSIKSRIFIIIMSDTIWCDINDCFAGRPVHVLVRPLHRSCSCVCVHSKKRRTFRIVRFVFGRLSIVLLSQVAKDTCNILS